MNVFANQNDVSHDENCRINVREVLRCSEAVTAINFARSRSERKYRVRNETTPGRPLNGSPSRPISERNHLAAIKKELRKGLGRGKERRREERRRKIANEIKTIPRN